MAGHRRLSLSCAAALALLVLAAGCGGDDPLSEDELVSRGDELCSEGQDRFAEIQAEPPENASAAADQTQELIEVAEDEVASLRDFEASDDEVQGALDSYVESREGAIELLEEGRDAAERQDGGAYGEAQSEVAASAGERLRLAREVGFEVCSEPQQAPG